MISACKHCVLTSVCQSDSPVRYSSLFDSFIKKTISIKRKEHFTPIAAQEKFLYAIRKGTLKTYYLEAQGKERVLDFYYAGEMLGFEALETGKFPFQVQAISDVELCVLSLEVWHEMIEHQPNMQDYLLRIASQRMCMGYCITHSTAEQKLLSFIMELVDRLHIRQEHDLQFELPMSQVDMANYLGLAPETVNREITKLQKQNLLSLKRKQLTIPSLKSLKNHIDTH